MKTAYFIFSIIILSGLLIACGGEGDTPLACTPPDQQPRKVLFIGNSITIHLPNPAVGWHSNWGMASSAADKDYVHLVMKALQADNQPIDYRLTNLYPWEKDQGYDLSNYQELRDFGADLIVIRLGDNADPSIAIKNDYYLHLEEMINFFNPGNTDKVIITSLYWANEQMDNTHKLLAQKKGYVYVKISQLSTNVSYTAAGMFSDKGVASHPGDKGMRAMADLILASIDHKGWLRNCPKLHKVVPPG